MLLANIFSNTRLLAVTALLAGGLIACDSKQPEQDSGRERIFASAEQVQPLLEGMRVPAFSVRQPDGETFDFDPAKLERPAVIYFYRGGWCPYCNAQLMELRNAEREVEEMGIDQYFISADSPATLREGLADFEEPLDYNVLSDNDLRAARKFGIAFKLAEETLQRYDEYGIDVVAASGRDHQSLPVPAVFIINTEGRIAFAYVNPDYRYRLHPDVLLAAASAALDTRNVRERAGDQNR